jgi:hypothetical protein
MLKTLRISDDLTLPLEWLTLATVVYGARGSGKTTFGSVAAEEAAKAKQRFCAIDLKGDWYGLKSTAAGTGAGLPVVIFGGDHADLPLEDGAGAFIGETIAALEQPAILDLEYFSKGKQVRFLAAFFERLYDKNRDPLLLLLDEAQRYAPQRPIDPDAAKCLGAVEDLVKLGRKHGIGPVLFTQRGSGLNKEVSELCDVLVAFRTPGPLDQDRIKDWLEANATKAQRDEVMGQLAGLQTGTAIVASGHPDLKLFGVHRIRRRETFDSSATPKIGQRKTEPKRLAQPDLDTLKTKMQDAIERAKADDPKELKKQIAQLKAEKAKAEQELARAAATPAPAGKPKDVPVLTGADRELLKSVREELAGFKTYIADRADATLQSIADRAKAEIDAAGERWSADVEKRRALFIERLSGTRVQRILDKVDAVVPSTVRPTPRPDTGVQRPVRQAPYVIRRVVTGPAPSSNGHLAGPEQKILNGLAELEALGLTPVDRQQLALMAGYTNYRSGGFSEPLGRLIAGGYAASPIAGVIDLTDDGRAHADAAATPTTSDALQARIMGVLPGPEQRILAKLIELYPTIMSREDLARALGYTNFRSGGFSEPLGRLATLKLVDTPRGAAVASSKLFLS